MCERLSAATTVPEVASLDQARTLIAARAAEVGAWLLSDEVYQGAERGGTVTHSNWGASDKVIVVNGLSKAYGLPGLRIGWLVGPPELALHAGNLTLCMLYGSPAFVQDAATVALTRDLPEVRDMAARYRRRRDAVTGRLSGLPGVSCHTPAGGMFVMLDVRPTGLTAEAFALGLLDGEGVSVLPGDAFGSPAAGHVRISLTLPEARIADACERIGRYVRGLAAS